MHLLPHPSTTISGFAVMLSVDHTGPNLIAQSCHFLSWAKMLITDLVLMLPVTPQSPQS